MRLLHLAHRAEPSGGVVADPAVQECQFLVGEAEIGLADRHQFVAAPQRRTCSRSRSCCACRGRAAHTSAPHRRSADRASTSTTGPSPGRADRRCRRASASAPRSRPRARRPAAPSVPASEENRISGDRSMRAGCVRAHPGFQPGAALRRRAAARRSSAPSNSMSYSRTPTGNCCIIFALTDLAVQPLLQIGERRDHRRRAAPAVRHPARRGNPSPRRFRETRRRCRRRRARYSRRPPAVATSCTRMPSHFHSARQSAGLQRGEVGCLQRMRQHRRAEHRGVGRIGLRSPALQPGEQRQIGRREAVPDLLHVVGARRRRSPPARSSPGGRRRRRAGRR